MMQTVVKSQKRNRPAKSSRPRGVPASSPPLAAARSMQSYNESGGSGSGDGARGVGAGEGDTDLGQEIFCMIALA